MTPAIVDKPLCPQFGLLAAADGKMRQVWEDCRRVAEPLTARQSRSLIRAPQRLVWLTDLAVGWLSLYLLVSQQALEMISPLRAMRP